MEEDNQINQPCSLFSKGEDRGLIPASRRQTTALTITFTMAPVTPLLKKTLPQPHLMRNYRLLFLLVYNHQESILETDQGVCIKEAPPYPNQSGSKSGNSTERVYIYDGDTQNGLSSCSSLSFT